MQCSLPTGHTFSSTSQRMSSTLTKNLNVWGHSCPPNIRLHPSTSPIHSKLTIEIIVYMCDRSLLSFVVLRKLFATVCTERQYTYILASWWFMKCSFELFQKTEWSSVDLMLHTFPFVRKNQDWPGSNLPIQTDFENILMEIYRNRFDILKTCSNILYVKAHVC